MPVKTEQVLISCSTQEAEYLEIILNIVQKLTLDGKNITVLILNSEIRLLGILIVGLYKYQAIMRIKNG